MSASSPTQQSVGKLTDIGGALGLTVYWTLALLGSMALIILVTMAFRKFGESRAARIRLTQARVSDTEIAAAVAAVIAASQGQPRILTAVPPEWKVSPSSAWKEAAKLSMTTRGHKE